MCGICGIFAIKTFLPAHSQCTQFISSLSHRGPNGQGELYEETDRLFLGHRRLSILDLSSAAKQPMSYADERFWITYNGEIFNFLELKEELSEVGYTFRTKSDTEVILASYLYWGDKCQFQFNGMWAFAIWDKEKKELFLSRDRFGIKPLHYFFDGNLFAFASEIKAFRQIPYIDLSFDLQQVANTIASPNTLEATGDTLFSYIKKIEAGHCARVSKNKGFVKWKWWETIDHLEKVPSIYEEQVEYFKELFFDACTLRLRSDVPIATALSGGIDSSSVVCTLAEIEKRKKFQRAPDHWKKAFCLYFPNTSYDELSYAKQAVEKSQFDSELLSANAMLVADHIDEVLYDFESIFDLPLGPWMLYKQMKKAGISISLDGHGADELFAGYHHQVEAAMAEASLSLYKIDRLTDIYKTLRSLYPEDYSEQVPGFLLSLFRGNISRSKSIHSVLQALFHKLRNRVKGGSHCSWFRITPKPHQVKFPNISSLSYLNRVLYNDFHWETLPTILRNFDRCSMAHGVEIRAPFLDWRFVCSAFSLPSSSKIGDGYTKRILRDFMRGILPEPIRTRTTKIGFASPMVEWLSTDLKPFILDELHSTSFLSSSIWNGKEICSSVVDAYKKNDILAVRKAWEFVQSNRLLEIFNREKAFR